MRATDIRKSDIGAQAAWKGFTSQTLYIANRLICDNDGYEFYPEDVEDLIIRNNGVVIEAVQIKNISSDLSISSLSSTKTSQNGDGMFKRISAFSAIPRYGMSSTSPTTYPPAMLTFALPPRNPSPM